MKRKIIYSDVPRPYDHDAAKQIRYVLVFMGACFLLTLLVVAFGGIA